MAMGHDASIFMEAADEALRNSLASDAIEELLSVAKNISNLGN